MSSHIYFNQPLKQIKPFAGPRVHHPPPKLLQVRLAYTSKLLERAVHFISVGEDDQKGFVKLCRTETSVNCQEHVAVTTRVLAQIAIAEGHEPRHFHRVVLQKLEPGQYSYRCTVSSSEGNKTSPQYTFTVGPKGGASGGVSMIVLGDMGLFPSSHRVIRALDSALVTTVALDSSDGAPRQQRAAAVSVEAAAVEAAAAAAAAAAPWDAILLAGDVSYASLKTFSEWDAWGDAMEHLTAITPFMTCPGNHDDEHRDEYRPRFLPTPQSPTHYSFELEGGSGASETAALVHVVSLNTEMHGWNSQYVNDAYGPGSPQLTWLEKDLSEVASRAVRPWVVVMMHRPLYTSNTHHPCAQWEGCAFLSHYEPLLARYGVSLVLSGHVHTYERTHPTVNHSRADGGRSGRSSSHGGSGSGRSGSGSGSGGPVYIGVGNSGYPLTTTPWVEPAPAWSAFRSSSRFGYSRFTVVNATHALWEATDAQDMAVFDRAWIPRRN